MSPPRDLPRPAIVIGRTPEPAARTLTEAGIPARTAASLGLRPGRDVRPLDAGHEVVMWAEATRRVVVRPEGSAALVGSPDGTVRAVETSIPEAARAAARRGLPRRVAVFGGSWVPEDDPEYAEARRLGTLLAEAGLPVLAGGYQGVMAAVSRGAREGGGASMAVTVTGYSDLVDRNPWLTHEVEADTLFARLPIILDADAWVGFAGGTGTLAEIAVGWNLVQSGLLAPRPLVVVGDRWARLAKEFRDSLLVPPDGLDLVTVAGTAEEAARAVAD